MTARKTHDKLIANVVRYEGIGIQIPKDMPLNHAIEIIRKLMEQEEQYVEGSRVIDVLPLDGAYAFARAAEELAGGLIGKASFWSDAQLKTLQVNYEGDQVEVPWGLVELAGLDHAELALSATKQGNKYVSLIRWRVKGKDREKVETLIKRTYELAMSGGVYRGQAFKIKFRDEDGDYLYEPIVSFIDTKSAFMPVFSDDLSKAIEDNILTIIRHTEAVRSLTKGSQVQRGVILAGDYGTGKTITAYWAARVAKENDWTFIYCEDPRELVTAMEFAVAYGPAVVFCEDINTVTSERDSFTNKILNVLDGVDNKTQDVVVVFTTNHLDQVHDSMLRSGRIDAILEIKPPDAETAVRMVQFFGGETIDPDSDLTDAGLALEGMKASDVVEVLKRAQLSAVTRTEGKWDKKLVCKDIVDAANQVKGEKALANRGRGVKPNELEQLGGQALLKGVKTLARLNDDNGTSPRALLYAALEEIETEDSK